MATYLPGVNDAIMQTQPFKPDWNIYSQTLAVKQSSYNTEHDKLSQLYGSLLNAPMTRQENIQSRDEFFKMVDQDIKKIAGMDLSKQSNQAQAQKVFSSIYDNNHIVKDMVWTKNYYNQLGVAEGFKNCKDPAKCGGQYWDTGVKAMNYKRQEFANASRDEAMGYDDVSYVPYQNYAEKMMEYAKKADLNITQDEIKNGYKITRKNGELLYTPLTELLGTAFKDNPEMLRQYKTEHYVNRKDWATSKVNDGTFADMNSAEVGYVQEHARIASDKLSMYTKDVNADYETLNEEFKQLEDKRKNGKIKEGSKDANRYIELAQNILPLAAEAKQYADVANSALRNLNNGQALHAIGDSLDEVLAHTSVMDSIHNSALVLSNKDKSVTMEPDEYAVLARKHSYDVAMENLKQQHKLEIEAQKATATKLGEFKYEKTGSRAVEDIFSKLADKGKRTEILNNALATSVEFRKLSDTDRKALVNDLIANNNGEVRGAGVNEAMSKESRAFFKDNKAINKINEQILSAKAKYIKDASSNLSPHVDHYMNNLDKTVFVNTNNETLLGSNVNSKQALLGKAPSSLKKEAATKYVEPKASDYNHDTVNALINKTSYDPNMQSKLRSIKNKATGHGSKTFDNKSLSANDVKTLNNAMASLSNSNPGMFVSVKEFAQFTKIKGSKYEQSNQTQGTGNVGKQFLALTKNAIDSKHEAAKTLATSYMEHLIDTRKISSLEKLKDYVKETISKNFKDGKYAGHTGVKNINFITNEELRTLLNDNGYLASNIVKNHMKSQVVSSMRDFDKVMKTFKDNDAFINRKNAVMSDPQNRSKFLNNFKNALATIDPELSDVSLDALVDTKTGILKTKMSTGYWYAGDDKYVYNFPTKGRRGDVVYNQGASNASNVAIKGYEYSEFKEKKANVREAWNRAMNETFNSTGTTFYAPMQVDKNFKVRSRSFSVGHDGQEGSDAGSQVSDYLYTVAKNLDNVSIVYGKKILTGATTGRPHDSEEINKVLKMLQSGKVTVNNATYEHYNSNVNSRDAYAREKFGKNASRLTLMLDNGKKLDIVMKRTKGTAGTDFDKLYYRSKDQQLTDMVGSYEIHNGNDATRGEPVKIVRELVNGDTPQYRIADDAMFYHPDAEGKYLRLKNVPGLEPSDNYEQLKADALNYIKLRQDLYEQTTPSIR